MGRSMILEDDTSKSCRICLNNSNQHDLISPCVCAGGSAYAHRKCLDNWRSMNKDGRAFQFCDICQFKYVIEPIIDDPSADKKRFLMFCLLFTLDIILIMLLVQLIIIRMTFLLEVADNKNQSIKNVYPTSTRSFIGIYYQTSLILFFAFFGFIWFIWFN